MMIKAVTQDGILDLNVLSASSRRGWGFLNGTPTWYRVTDVHIWVRSDPGSAVYLGRWQHDRVVTSCGVVDLAVSPLGDLGVEWLEDHGELKCRAFLPTTIGIWSETELPGHVILPMEVM